ncbi:MAG TPA: hypothetical protein VGO93_24725 [Candidatus Xenobia bacterium]
MPRDRYLYIIALASVDAFLLTPMELSELQAHIKVARRIADLVRQRIRTAAAEIGVVDDRLEALVTAAAEAPTNGLHHAVKPICDLSNSPNYRTLSFAQGPPARFPRGPALKSCWLLRLPTARPLDHR